MGENKVNRRSILASPMILAIPPIALGSVAPALEIKIRCHGVERFRESVSKIERAIAERADTLHQLGRQLQAAREIENG